MRLVECLQITDVIAGIHQSVHADLDAALRPVQGENVEIIAEALTAGQLNCSLKAPLLVCVVDVCRFTKEFEPPAFLQMLK